MAVLWDILVAFTRANLLGYGGGPSVIPLIEAEVVDHYRWMSAEEFADALAVGNALPGPIATKMAAYIGYQVAGIPGALAGLIGTVLPTVALMLLLAGLLLRFRDAPAIQGAIRGAKAVVWVLFLLLVIEYLPFVLPGRAGWLAALIGAGALVALLVFKLPVPLVMAAGIVAGGLLIR